MSKRLTPQLRFKGYTDEWKSDSIGNVARTYSGGTPTAGCVDYYGGSIPFIRSGEIHGNTTELFLTDEGLAKSSAAIVSKGTILYALYGATSGEVAISQINGAINQAILAIITNDDNDSYCLSYWLHQNKLSIINTYLQGGQGNLSGAIVKSIEFILPRIFEQREIGEYFKQIDDLIAQAEREIERLEKMKLASLQKMFPRPGTTTPEIRFAGFSGEWELKCLGEIGSTYTGLSGKTKEDFGHGAAHFITYMNVFSNPIASPKQVEPIEIDKSQYAVRYGDIFFTTSSETPEEVGMSSVWLYDNKHVYLNSFCFGFRPNVKIDLKYIAYFLRSPFFRSQMIILAQGISRFNISKLKAMELPVLLPSLAEQKAIGEYFRNLNELISSKRQKLSKLRNIKKACLDKMFVNSDNI